jgi:hypothetical protein
MASAKQGSATRGPVPADTASPPFATRSGRATVTDSGAPPGIDSVGRSTAPAAAPGIDFARTAGAIPDGAEGQPIDWGNPAQDPGRPEYRVDVESIATGGIFAPLQAGNASRERDPGPSPASLPFKNLK